MNRQYTIAIGKIDEDKLISGCARGERSAQDELYYRFAPAMLKVCLRFASSTAEAEDILQDGFVKIFHSIHRFRKIGTLANWIRRIMINESISYYRKNRKTRFQDNIDAINETEILDPFDPGEVTETPPADIMLEMIQSLPPGYRMVFSLYVFEEFSHKEISEQLGISESTSKTQLKKARKALVKMLMSHGKTRSIFVKHG